MGRLTVCKGFYWLTLGTDVFEGMLNSFSNSMERKRPLEYRNFKINLEDQD